MRKLIAIDDGHGMETAGKRTPPIPELNNRVIRENEFNREVKKYLDLELKRCGLRTIIVAPGDKDIPLKDRVDLANEKKADAYVSIHYNAFDGKFTGNDPEGHSVHIYPNSMEGRELAKCVLKHLVQGTRQRNRGIKENNFYVLRNTDMPAILSENGFMDNKREALLMINTEFQKEVAREHAQGICDYFKVKYIPEPKPIPANKDVLYRVQTGAFSKLDNAVAWEEEMKKLGEDTYLVQAEDGLYKVQIGAYSKKSNADRKAKQLKKQNIPTFITAKSGKPISAPKVDINKIAIEVINGQWGTGRERKEKLEKAGYDYNEVQSIVNDIAYKGQAKPSLKVGDKVKVRKGAKDYNKRGLAYFVYLRTYEVLQIRQDRAVIGKNKSVTAAVNIKDLIIV